MRTILFLLVTFFIGMDCAHSQTQGKWEIASIKDIYSKKYTDTLYKKYEITITKENSHSYRFSDRILLTSSETNELELLLMNGLLYPQLLTGDSTIKYSPQMKGNPFMRLSQNDTLSISGFQEVEVYPQNYQKKRFSFSVWFKGMMNPSLYTLELTNNTATATTSVQNFFKNASLTFLKFITILI